MNILIIGQADSVFFEYYSKQLKLYCSDINITIFSLDEVYSRNDLSACDTVYVNPWNNSILINFKGLRTILEPILTCYYIFLFLRSSRKKFDIIHFKWLKSSIVLSSFFIRHFSNRIISMLWGGEFHNQRLFFSHKLYFFFLRLFLKKMDVITYSNDEDLSSLTNMVRQKVKLKHAIYGSEVLKEIQTKLSKFERGYCKNLFGIDDTMITISLGYSGKRIHQQLLVLKLLMKNDNFVQIKGRLLFILPMTYGRDEQYQKVIEDYMNINKIQYKVLVEKLSNSDVAFLRLATDIFIQTTKFDGRSSSVIEYLLAGSVMISGSWLPYNVFKERSLYFYEVHEIESSLFSNLLVRIVHNISSELSLAKSNQYKWGFGETWEGVMPNWINNIYKLKNH